MAIPLLQPGEFHPTPLTRHQPLPVQSDLQSTEQNDPTPASNITDNQLLTITNEHWASVIGAVLGLALIALLAVVASSYLKKRRIKWKNQRERSFKAEQRLLSDQVVQSTLTPLTSWEMMVRNDLYYEDERGRVDPTTFRSVPTNSKSPRVLLVDNRRNGNKIQTYENEETVILSQHAQHYPQLKFFRREQIKLGQQLGEGHFGAVYKGR